MGRYRVSDERRESGVVLLAVVALIHLSLVPEHAGQAPYVGGLFLLDGVTSGVSALGVRRDALVWGWVLGALVSLGTLVMYFEVRALGLPNFSEEHLVEHLGVAALVVEGLFLYVFARVLSTRSVTGRTTEVPSHRP